jgi:hypothetical protein
VHRPTLDDVFLHFTGRAIREGSGNGRGGAGHGPQGMMMRVHMGARRR